MGYVCLGNLGQLTSFTFSRDSGVMENSTGFNASFLVAAYGKL